MTGPACLQSLSFFRIFVLRFLREWLSPNPTDRSRKIGLGLRSCKIEDPAVSGIADPVYVDFAAGIAQLVERNLAKVDVAGSSPVSRSTL